MYGQINGYTPVVVNPIVLSLARSRYYRVFLYLSQRRNSMRGIVEMTYPAKGVIAVKTENDEFSVVEVIDSYFPELGSIVSGPLEELGEETLKCLNDGIEFDVCIQDIHSSHLNAKQMLRNY